MGDHVICESTLIGCGVAQSPHSLDWHSNTNSVIFASANNVCIMREKLEGALSINHCLHGHKSQVNCVKWVYDEGDCCYFASGSSDATCILWKFEDNCAQNVKEFNFNSPISHIVGYKAKDDIIKLVVCSSDSVVKVCNWSQKNGTEDATQELSVGAGFALCADICALNNSIHLVALACDTNVIKLYAFYDSAEAKFLTEISGHTDWIRDISFNKYSNENGNIDVFLASCSQDTFVRIWKISHFIDLPPKNGQLRVRPTIFNVESEDYSITLESVLCGHESWVYSVRWHPTDFVLLTSSMDKCIIVWQADKQTGVWIENTRLGDVGGQSVGYYGAVFNKDATKILAHSYHGGLRLWYRNKEVNDDWICGVVDSGQSCAVEDICWEGNGEYLLSCSSDQTTRLYARWCRNDKVSIHEIARPQVHGYDMRCISQVNKGCFISGSEEKIFRVFMAPKNFLKNYSKISKRELDITLDDAPDGASVPSLGLSNKAVDIGTVDEGGDTPSPKDIYPVYNFRDILLSQPPSEDILLQNTLWPEIHKLYGHGSEVFCVCTNNEGSLCASACKATKAEHATILIWCTKSWQIVARLTNHNLTVTRLAFSPSNKYLLSVSRDRTWAIFKSNKDNDWVLFCKSDKKTCHSRIIWDCCWTSDSKYFLTASRDKKVSAWKFEENEADKVGLVSSLQLDDAVTAVHIAPDVVNGTYIIAIGLENGTVKLYKTIDCFTTWISMQMERDILSHSGSIKRLQFRPVVGSWIDNNDSRSCLELASAGSDNCVKVTLIVLNL